MEQEFYQFGVKYLRWEKNGYTFEAVKEQVEILGKEVFEQDFDLFLEKDGSQPCGCTWVEI